MTVNDLMHVCIVLGKKIPAMTYSKKTGKHNLPKKDWLLAIASSAWAEFKDKKYEKNNDTNKKRKAKPKQNTNNKIKGLGHC